MCHVGGHRLCLRAIEPIITRRAGVGNLRASMASPWPHRLCQARKPVQSTCCDDPGAPAAASGPARFGYEDMAVLRGLNRRERDGRLALGFLRLQFALPRERPPG